MNGTFKPYEATEDLSCGPAHMLDGPVTATAPATHRRPCSLREVLRWGQQSGDTDGFLREFLDEFYLEPDAGARAAMLADEPPLVARERGNAYLAAVAEHLALRHHLPIPEWTRAKCRFLKRPWYPCGLESLKATLLVESPPAFRRRLIFVGADPLYRPRRDRRGIGESPDGGKEVRD